MLAVIGKRFGDAGLRDLSVESGVIADGSIVGVLDGKKYNRAIRLHTLVYEALLRLAWSGFEAWLGDGDKNELAETLLHVTDFAENISGETWLEFQLVHSCSQDYLDFLRTENGDLSTFWMSYVDMVEIVLGLQHPDLQQSRILKDEADVQSLVNLMEDSWINPFRSDQDSLVSLATAAMPPMEIAHDLMNASKVGEEAFEAFRTRRLENNTVDFFATMKKQKLKTFSDVYTKKVTCKGKEIVLKADRNLFGHIIVVAQTRKLEMKKVISYPLGPIPLALANADGSLRKPDKAKFMNDIAQNVPVVEVFTENISMHR